MPSFELVVLIQQLEREALKNALKRTANYIFEQGATIRKIENLGFRNLPFFMNAKGRKHRFANYFIFNYDTGMKAPRLVLEKVKLDLDIVRATNFIVAPTPVALHSEKKKKECTLHIDLLPAPLRPTVIELQEIGRKKRRRFQVINKHNPDFDIF